MLVGRDSERRALATVLAAARVADSRALVLSGEAGIGKTTLLKEARMLAGDMRVLSAQGVESERYVPFAGLLQVLRPVLGLLDQIPAPQSTALASALALGPVDEPDRKPSRFAVGAATLSRLARAAEDRALAVLIDDGHLLDAPSAEALVFAARRMLSDAVALLVAVRPEEPGARTFDALPGLPIAGLDEAATRSLLACADLDARGTKNGDPILGDRVRRLHRVTAGNPLALLELHDQVELLDARPPSSPVPVSERVTGAFLRRVDGLPEAARVTLTVASADAGSLRAVLQATLTLGVESPTLVPAQDAGLVTLHGDLIEFRHPLVQAAVYAAAPPTLRRTVHRSLAKVLPATDVHRLAWHLSEGADGPDEETAATLDRVAAQAAARGAHTIAAHAYERAAALTLDPTLVPQRLATAGEAAWLAGRTEVATDLLQQALAAGPMPLLRAHVQELQGAVLVRGGSLDVALRTLTEAAVAIAPLDADRAVRLNADVVHAAFYLMDPRAAMEACRRIDELLTGEISEGTRELAISASGMALVLGGAGAEGVNRLRDMAYRLVPEPPETERFRLPLRLQGALWLRDAGPDRGVVADALERMREHAAIGLMPYLLMQVARDAATSDRWDEAESAYHEAEMLAQEIGQTTDFAVSVAGHAIVDARRGRASAVHSHVAGAGPIAEQNNVRLATVWLHFAQGDLAAGAGDLETAVGHYTTLEELLAAVGMADPDQSCAPELVECLVHQRRTTQAAALAATFAAKADAKGQAWTLARSARALGLCSDDPEASYLQSLALHARTPDGYERARTQLAYGAWLRRARRRVDARPVLRAALETFESLGATPWADRAAQELDATGETVHRGSTGEVQGALTPQERQIAQLLAQGRTTRQAAAALFLSPKTVEYHLRHVYLKLEINSRSELTDRFG